MEIMNLHSITDKMKEELIINACPYRLNLSLCEFFYGNSVFILIQFLGI